MNWVLTLYVLGLALVIMALGGAVDALDRDREAWRRAGYRRGVWIWQAAAILVLPVVAVVSGFYLLQVRPSLAAAERELDLERWSAGYVPIAVPADPANPRVRIRTSLPAALVILLPLVPSFVTVAFEAISEWPGRAADASILYRSMPFATLLLGGVAVWRTFSFGVTLTPDCAVINGLRRRRLLWSEVTGIVEGRRGGWRRLRIHTCDGRSYWLRAPATGYWSLGDRRFDQDFHRIGQWWLTRRGR